MKHPFVYHAPSPEQVARITRIREACKAAYEEIEASAPASAERTLAVRSLQQCSMWANLSIVLEEGTPIDESQSPAACDNSGGGSIHHIHVHVDPQAGQVPPSLADQIAWHASQRLHPERPL